MRGPRAAFVAACAATVAVAVTWRATAQRFDAKRARTFVVGPPRALAITERVDGQRTGLTQTALPRGPLRVAWKRPLGLTLDRAPLVTLNGEVIVVGGRGDVVTLGEDGAEKVRVNTGALAAGAPTLTSDGTAVFVSSLGEAIGVRGGAVRYRTRVANDRSPTSRVSPLPLDDGGVVVPAGAELVVLDADGNVRTRRPLPEVPVGALLDARGQVLAVGPTGTVYAWSPEHDVARVGSFGGPVDEGAAFDGDKSVIAVVANRQLIALDLERGVATVRATPSIGLFLGPPSIAPRGGPTYMFLQTHSNTIAFALDTAGQEVWSARIATFAPALSPDGGVAAIPVPAHVGALVDPSGVLAFSTPSGFLGVVSGCNAGGACVVDTLGEPPCARAALAGPRLTGGVAGLAPAGIGAFVVSCESGTVIKVEELRPAAPARAD